MNFTFNTDDDTKRLLEITIHFLRVYFHHSEADAVDMMNQYYQQWKHLHDDDFYHHISSFEVAVRVHYFIAMNGSSDEYIQWRRANGLNHTPAEAKAYFRSHYFVE